MLKFDSSPRVDKEKAGCLRDRVGVHVEFLFHPLSLLRRDVRHRLITCHLKRAIGDI